ncbi:MULTISPECIES: immunity 26/phosphotriesterase HocA family protein [Salmonella]|nr:MULTISPECIES: immunity 26/phosphotriesterase HocA family protein [Salmonella]ERG01292.1 phosphotriesterase [Salmonella enterica subsp. enterica serovar Muenchen str. RKS4129]ESG75356.1 phosphotriesterase [Salmonella enterica subsp. enterica serovar Muenchen str. baa1594]WQN55490.1 immunity 26/phosphotriesterase HocA family protein [Salmonella enterica subsp. enterica serovar Newport str. S-38A-RVX]WQN60072.1 immunity 26/phosphotriesterase HocA family protein [Salmonella enterica subsp. enter
MSDYKFWGWDKKPRTMLRFVKPGDIFCFKLDEDRYCFGRIITLMTVGHLSELFDIIKKSPGITELEISNARRIIEHQVNYNPKNLDGIYFALGIGDSCKKKDCYGNDFLISESEWKTLPKLSPKGGFDIKKRLEIA